MGKRIQPWKPLRNFSREELCLISRLIMKGHRDPQGCLQTGRNNVWISLPTKLPKC